MIYMSWFRFVRCRLYTNTIQIGAENKYWESVAWSGSGVNANLTWTKLQVTTKLVLIFPGLPRYNKSSVRMLKESDMISAQYILGKCYVKHAHFVVLEHMYRILAQYKTFDFYNFLKIMICLNLLFNVGRFGCWNST